MRDSYLISYKPRRRAAETTAAAAATAADRAQLVEKMVKLKRVATLYVVG